MLELDITATEKFKYEKAVLSMFIDYMNARGYCIAEKVEADMGHELFIAGDEKLEKLQKGFMDYVVRR